MSEPTDIAASQFRLLVQEVDEYAIFLLDPQGHVVSWNEGAKKIKGYSTDEILGQHFSTFYPAEATEAGTPERALRSARREGKWIDEGWRVRQDGSRFWARVTITAVREEGRLQGFAKITHDLSDRRRREQELERKTQQRNKENALLRLMQKVTETANRADSLEGALEEAIPIICTHIGWPVGHVYWLREAGDHPLAPTGIWHLDKPDRFRQFRAVTEAVDFAMGESLPGRVAETKAPYWIRDVTSDESFVRSKRARNLGVKGAFGVPVKREDDIVAVLEFFSEQAEEQDDQLKEAIESVGLQLSRVAEREAARQSLRESEEKFRAVAEQTIVGIGFIQDGVYKYVNPALAQYVGYEQTDLIGCSPKRFIHPDDWPRVQEALRRRASGEQDEMQYTARAQTRDGNTVYLEIYGRRIEYQGRPAIVGAVLDVSKRRQLEEELLQIQDAERQRLGQELHDGVGSLLTAAGIKISGLIGKLRKGEPIGPDALDAALGYIKDAGDEARAIAHGLSPIGLENGLRSALADLAEQAELEAALTCVTEVSDAVPDLSEKTATQLYRICQEAISNAVKHADANTIRVCLTLENGAPENGGLILRVQDDGCGIEASSSSDGIGMRTMRHRANLIGGTLTIEQAPRGGTVVQCRVPSPVQRQDASTSDGDA